LIYEHKFSKGKILVGFANVETLKKYADVDYSELALGKIKQIAQHYFIYLILRNKSKFIRRQPKIAGEQETKRSTDFKSTKEQK
jgi:hypothetical protein